jgi:hypothetical protein
MTSPPAGLGPTEATLASAATEAEIVDVLRDPRSWPAGTTRVDTVETHGARVFLAGDTALKVRRPIRLPYLDFSTLEARRAYGERELALNAPHAPGLYDRLVPIIRAPDGTLALDGGLALDGPGTVVEWAVRMRRFDQDALLSAIADRDGITPDLAVALADMAAAYHRTAPVAAAARDGLPDIARAVLTGLADAGIAALADRIAALTTACDAALVATADVRGRRARDGHVRRCHGDLHLGNIVLIDGRPLPFDALEFDEALATIDTLYDLAFLLMDLWRRGQRTAATTVLGRYLWRTGDASDLEALAALPVSMAVRAAVRALVALDRATVGAGAAADLTARAAATLDVAATFLAPVPARLVAVGGLSGTGKSTLAAALATGIGRPPGAVHLRSDLERKALAGVDALDRLPPSAYTPTATADVYARLTDRAARILASGQGVIVDAVFARPEERAAIERVAAAAGVPFVGLWLAVSADTARARVAGRVGDASDATAAVVDLQRGYDVGPITWHRLAADGPPADVAHAAAAVLGQPG